MASRGIGKSTTTTTKATKTMAKKGGLNLSPRRYPTFRRDPEAKWEPRSGQVVREPYAWLEDPDAEETKEFVSLQNELTQEVLGQCPSRESYKSLLTKLMDFPKSSPPKRKGKRWFYHYNTGLQAQSVLFSHDSPDADPSNSRVLLDPNKLSTDGTVALSSSAFSNDGTRLAYSLSSGGSDWVTVKVMDIDAEGEGTQLEDDLKWVKFTSLAWTHDNKGFFYNAYPEPVLKTQEAGTETDSNTKQRLMYHVVGEGQEKDVKIWEAGENGFDETWLMGAEISDDGRYAILTVAFGCDAKNRLYVLPLTSDLGLPPNADHSKALPVVENMDAEYDFVCNEGNLLYFKTNLNAPRGKIVRVDITDASKYGKPETLDVVIDEADEKDVLEWAYGLKCDVLVCCYLKNARHVLQLRSLGTGELTRVLEELPVGSVAGFSGNREDAECFIKLTGFTSPGTMYRLDTASPLDARAAVFKETELDCGAYTPEDLVTEQVFVKSKDGTGVPMFVVGSKDAMAGGAEGAALLYGYGGFNISLKPSFSASRLAWVLGFNGVAAVACLRGGGEYGEDWHKAGTKLQKQNVFDDFQACGEHLIREGYCEESKLAIEGGSNGGLLVGACLNQRPDLFTCGIAHVGVMDMLKFQKFTIGHAWCTDFGNSEASDEEFEYLRNYSPLHNIPSVSEATYPSTMVLTGDHDDRVVPLHSLKFIAELQHQQIGAAAESEQTNPLIARIETRAGHGAGKPTAKIIQQAADVYGFVAACCEVAWNAKA